MAQVDFDHPLVPRTVDGVLGDLRRRARLRLVAAAVASAAMLGIFALVVTALG